jgi:ketosteroid isomerase-like protein
MRAIRVALLTAGITGAMTGCQKPAPEDQSAAAVEAVKAADAAWEKAFSSRDMNGSLDAVEADASVLPPNAPIATGHPAIKVLFLGFYQIPGLDLHWQATRAEAARSGELAYTSGTYVMKFNDPKGNPLTDKGKYATVWRKQADGSWKVVLDVFNSDLPQPGS